MDGWMDVRIDTPRSTDSPLLSLLSLLVTQSLPSLRACIILLTNPHSPTTHNHRATSTTYKHHPLQKRTLPKPYVPFPHTQDPQVLINQSITFLNLAPDPILPSCDKRPTVRFPLLLQS
ncbi:hypothetical protein BU24DRAFT_287493 [Aaosphaeria arxii CBS 175.79]|uniref:Uncharacterized protein n=1 Tax=Aaosphaeria arxii CBS 175.79 TaxID=1450172 RepID=A0A6A5XEP5_9PLEO|nr:uncharacterized protein BU24DRAFT_287493 [Aaosphaeria arxii CBS 175.79]KAF2011705.1 hypothetical protein BU24DRAFT_287493 [Aaosphaeria arxii CBS 175.79]